MRHLRIALLVFLSMAAVATGAYVGAADAGRALSASSITLLALDADTSGNGPRTVGSIEDCVSVTIGQALDVDIVVPNPGIPADRGIAGYQFRLFYDPNIVWISADESKLLLNEASGSTVIAFSDPVPNMSGDYVSVVVDFGQGIEPAGASEVGPGVLARLTLLPQGEGSSPLILSEVEIAADDSGKIPLDSIQSATIHVGEPCPGQSQTLTPTPSPTGTTPPPAADTSTPTLTGPTTEPSEAIGAEDTVIVVDDASGLEPGMIITIDGEKIRVLGVSGNEITVERGVEGTEAAAHEPSTPILTDFSPTGGPPPPKGDVSLWLIVGGLAASLVGAALLMRGRFPGAG